MIGQCIAGIDMFSRAHSRHGLIVPVAVVRSTPDPALSWVCNRRCIAVETAPESDVQELRRQDHQPELAIPES